MNNDTKRKGKLCKKEGELEEETIINGLRIATIFDFFGTLCIQRVSSGRRARPQFGILSPVCLFIFFEF